MIRRLFLLLFALAPGPAIAGTRAIFSVEEESPRVVQIADNGDVSADLTGGYRFVIRSGQAYVIEDRWTGPIVTRVEDLAAVAAERYPTAATAPLAAASLVERGTEIVNGRSGRAFFNRRDNELAWVISDDPDLAELAAVYRQWHYAEALVGLLEWQWPADTMAGNRADAQLVGNGMPVKGWRWSLRSIERTIVAADAAALPAEPENRDALRARLAREAAERAAPPRPDDMISRAVYVGGRLYLLADNGSLSSLAEGDRVRTPLDPGEPVLDLCVDRGTLLALTGQFSEGRSWTLRRWDGRRWQSVRIVRRAADVPMALTCTADETILLTSFRLIDLRNARSGAINLRGGPIRMMVNALAYVTPDALFVGINAGEWGGGLKRIDRRTGRIDTIERNATGHLCDGPLNSHCDPVHGIAAIPWRPGCIAVAIGLIHWSSHGRIASVCPGGIEQLYAGAADVDPDNAQSVAEAAQGGYGSVAFFGLDAADGRLVAAGHNGLYRIGADGQASHHSWPRFVEADGILVSFAEPGYVLVLTGINGRASLSGAVPILVRR